MSEKPNVLLIHTDQQSLWTISAYGTKEIDTPNIDRIAKDGVLFKEFFTVSAVCTPSRGAFFTGRYPHCNGAYKNNLPLNRDEVTFAHQLKKEGYNTAYIGKWHLDGDQKPGWLSPFRSMGFSECQHMFNRGHYKSIIEKENDYPDMSYALGLKDSVYTTDWLTDKAVEYIKNKDENPFLLTVSYPDPHNPFSVRPPYDTMFKPEDMKIPETFTQKNLPNWAQKLSDNFKEEGLTEEQIKIDKAKYLGEVKCIDDNLGRIYETLDELGLTDNTLIVFTADHGEYMGEHGLMFKNAMYETAYHIPLLMSWPKKLAKGVKVDQLIDVLDFQPTLLGLLGIEKSGREQGNDASAILMQEDLEWNNECYLHFQNFTKVGVITEDYYLMYVKDSEPALYHRKNDPFQHHNIYNNVENKMLVKSLTERVITHQYDYDSPAKAWMGQLEQLVLD